MTLARALNDVRELKRELEDDFSGRLQYDFSENRDIRIDGFAFPEGWENRSGGRHGSLLIAIPEAYPEHAPRIYISEDMRYQGSRPQCMAPARFASTADWAPLSLFNDRKEWNPDTDSLVTRFNQLHRVLSNPVPLDSRTDSGGETND